MNGKIATISAAVVTLGLIGAMVYYGSQSEYGVLFSDLKPADAQTIVEKLKAENVSLFAFEQRHDDSDSGRTCFRTASANG